MKSIELTEDHKSKLLEMCKVLFPEYIEINIDISENYDGIQDYIQLRKKYENTIFIHWFEFCMTHLYSKVIGGDYLTQAQTSGMIFYKHPVDYLYDVFKKHEK